MGRLGSLMPARARMTASATAAHRLVLADHAAVQLLFETQELLHLAFHQLRHRDARPARDDLGDVLLVDFLLEESPAAPGRGRSLGLGLLQLALQRRERAVLQLGGAVQVVDPHDLVDLEPDFLDALPELARPLDRRLLALPLLPQGLGLLLQARELPLELHQPVAGGGVGLLLQRLALDLELQDAARDLVQLGRHRVDLGAQPRRRLVHQVDGLVGQEPIGDVAVRQHGRGHHRRVLDAHAVVVLVPLAQPAEDRDRVLHRGLIDHDGLEAPLEGGVLFDVLLVLVERGRADAVQLAAGQGRLEQIARVHGPLGRARAHDRVQLVDEEDDLALRVLHGLEDGLEPLLELATVLGAGDQRAHVERHDALVLQPLGHVAADDALGQPLDDRGLARRLAAR